MKSVELFRTALRSKWKHNGSAAKALNVGDSMISDVLAGRRRISVWLARQVEIATGTPGVAVELLHAQVADDLEELALENKA